MTRCPVCGVESEGMVLHEGSHTPASMTSPTWDELDAIRKGKSDIDLAERIWRLERAAENTAPNLRKASVAQDWVLVPMEPTPHMMRAVELSPSNARYVWRAMLAAAPKVKP